MPERQRRVRAIAAAVFGVCLGFVVLVIVLQCLRTDLDWTRATLSLYLHGRYGLLLRMAYCILAVAIALLAWTLHAQSADGARRGLPPVLFSVAALGLATVAIGDSWLPGYAPALAPLVHGLAAQTAFVCVSVAMLVQAWCFGRDPRWRAAYRWAWGWAWLVFGGLWLHVLWRGSPRGLGQKLVIAAVVIWLAAVACRLWREDCKETPETSGCGHNGGTSTKGNPP